VRRSSINSLLALVGLLAVTATAEPLGPASSSQPTSLVATSIPASAPASAPTTEATSISVDLPASTRPEAPSFFKKLTPPFLLSLGFTAGGYVLFDLVTASRINRGATELQQVFGLNLPMALSLTAMLAGPGAGYFYTNKRGRAVLTAALRTTGALTVARVMSVCLGRNCSFSDSAAEGATLVGGALGGALWLGLSAYDLVALFGKPRVFPKAPGQTKPNTSSLKKLPRSWVGVQP
jgi:hypothetical protein